MIVLSYYYLEKKQASFIDIYDMIINLFTKITLLINCLQHCYWIDNKCMTLDLPFPLILRWWLYHLSVTCTSTLSILNQPPASTQTSLKESFTFYQIPQLWMWTGLAWELPPPISCSIWAKRRSTFPPDLVTGRPFFIVVWVLLIKAIDMSLL